MDLPTSKEENIADAETLSDTFDQIINLRDYIEETDHPSNSREYQNSVKNAVSLLEKATHMVNQLSMFSSNETIEEVATSDLKYLLLPSLLGYFTIKLTNSDPAERIRLLSLSELYYKDFLKRCKSYELSNVSIPDIKDEEEASNEKIQSTMPDLVTLSANRNEKIRRYNLIKEVEAEINRLKDLLKIDDNHEEKREYYLALLKRWVLRACEELSSIKMEKTLLQNMPSKKAVDQQKKNMKPLTPVIIVRNELQKRVFGLGYPSMPTMTVDEFYRQRYPEVAENGNSSAPTMHSLQQMAADPEETKKQIDEENAQEEYLIEIEDPAKIQRDRAFDEWKDENRRGCGNRKNKG